MASSDCQFGEWSLSAKSNLVKFGGAEQVFVVDLQEECVK